MRTYKVGHYPTFLILDASGNVVTPDSTPFGLRIIRSPLQAASDIFQTQLDWSLKSGIPSTRADVVLAQLGLLHAARQPTQADAWLARALANPKLRPFERRRLLVYEALRMRQAGRLAEGLSLLRTVAPRLTLTEAGGPGVPPGSRRPGFQPGESSSDSASGGNVAWGGGPPPPMPPGLVAPFSVSHDGTVLGTVSSDADAHLTADALGWLDSARGARLDPSGLHPAQLRRGVVAFATVLNRPADAAAWRGRLRAVTCPRGGVGCPALIYADGLIALSEGKNAAAGALLTGVVSDSPGAAFAPMAGALACQALTLAGDTDAAKRCRQLLQATYGDRLPREVAARLGAG